jgi:hypothetical protein
MGLQMQSEESFLALRNTRMSLGQHLSLHLQALEVEAVRRGVVGDSCYNST